MKNKRTWSIVVAIIVILIVVGLSSNKSKVAKLDSIKIAVIAPLTGEAASYGDGIKAGTTLAAKEINDAGGINGVPIELIFEDDQCNSKGGINAYTKVVNTDKPVFILGSMCTASVAPGAPIAQKAGVPVIEWGSAPDLPKIGDYIFRTYPSDAFQGKFAAEFIYNDLGKKTVAVLFVKNDWGQGIRDVFVKRFTELGGTVVFNDSAPQDSTDVRTQMTKIKGSNPEALYLPLYPAVGAVALKQFRNVGMNVPVVSGDASDTTEITSLPEAEGLIYTIAKFSNPDEFKARVKSVTGMESNVATPLSYDSLYIAAQVIGEAGTDGEAIIKALSKTRYTKGVSLPLIEFDADGDLASAEFDVKVVQNKKGVLYTK